VQRESGAAMVNVTVATKELQTCTAAIRRKTRLAMRAIMTVLPTETQMQLHCGVIRDKVNPEQHVQGRIRGLF